MPNKEPAVSGLLLRTRFCSQKVQYGTHTSTAHGSSSQVEEDDTSIGSASFLEWLLLVDFSPCEWMIYDALSFSVEMC